jgi:hypothetical protein
MYKIEKFVLQDECIIIKDNKRFFCSFKNNSKYGISYLVDTIQYITCNHSDYHKLLHQIINLLKHDSNHLSYCSTTDLYD